MYFPVIRNNRNNWLDTAFNDLFDMDWAPRHVTTAPAVNVKESDKAFTMEVAAPGLKKEFCKVNINNEGNLVVKIENKSEHEDKSCKEEGEKFHYVRREFTKSGCRRRLDKIRLHCILLGKRRQRSSNRLFPVSNPEQSKLSDF